MFSDSVPRQLYSSYEEEHGDSAIGMLLQGFVFSVTRGDDEKDALERGPSSRRHGSNITGITFMSKYQLKAKKQSWRWLFTPNIKV